MRRAIISSGAGALIGTRSFFMNPMASQRQIAANRRNARLGGPKTETGKQQSRLNSIRHGLTSSSLTVLPEEDLHEYEDILRGFRESLQPHGALEEALVLRLAQTHWRGLRSRRVETGMLDITAVSQRGLARQLVQDCPEHLDPHKAIGVGFLVTPPGRWHTYLRYDTAISRDFFRTLDTLTRIQRARHPGDKQSARIVAGAAGCTTELSDSGIRFVSKNDTSDALSKADL